ncbi:MAG: hypothetical protein VXA43_06210 [Candidatus Poseidoniales archaeon]
MSMRVPNVKSFLRNLLVDVLLRLRFLRLGLRNRFASSSIVDPAGPTVSMTTYGPRLKHVHIVIETIAKGTMLPSRFMLYLDVEDDVRYPTKALERLKKRGLEIHLSENLGPHTKVQWWVQNAPDFSRPHVVADDDIFYPKRWLEGIVEASQRDPDSIMAYRAHRMVLNNEKSGLAPYQTWPPGIKGPSHLNFATCVSGVLFPPHFLNIMRKAGDGFRTTCPRQDDVWLTFQAIEHGIGIGLVTGESLHFDLLPGSQEVALHATNVFEQQNDVQLRQTFLPSTYATLAEHERLLKQQGLID